MKVGSCVKSTQNLARVKILWEDPLNFWTCIKKMTHILITVQSFAAIGRWSSVILWLTKKRVKQNEPRNMGQSPT